MDHEKLAIVSEDADEQQVLVFETDTTYRISRQEGYLLPEKHYGHSEMIKEHPAEDEDMSSDAGSELVL